MSKVQFLISDDVKFRPLSGVSNADSSSVASAKSLESGERWVLDREKTKCTDDDTFLHEQSYSYVVGNQRKAAMQETAAKEKAKRGTKNAPLGSGAARKQCLHPQFGGKSPYLVPVVRAVGPLKQNPAASGGNGSSGGKGQHPSVSCSLDGGMSSYVKSSLLSSAVAGWGGGGLIADDDDDAGAASTKRMMRSLAGAAPPHSYLRHQHSNTSLLPEEAVRSASPDAVPAAKAGSPPTTRGTSDGPVSPPTKSSSKHAHVDPLYDIMRSNKIELLRFALHVGKEQGLLSYHTDKPEWARYFEYNLSAFVNADGGNMREEYQGLRNTYIRDMKHSVSERVCGMGPRFKKTAYYPGRKGPIKWHGLGPGMSLSQSQGKGLGAGACIGVGVSATGDVGASADVAQSMTQLLDQQQQQQNQHQFTGFGARGASNGKSKGKRNGDSKRPSSSPGQRQPPAPHSSKGLRHDGMNNNGQMPFRSPAPSAAVQAATAGYIPTFPLDEFIVVCPDEVSKLATFGSPPVEMWATLKAVFYIFFSYQTHLEMLREAQQAARKQQAPVSGANTGRSTGEPTKPSSLYAAEAAGAQSAHSHSQAQHRQPDYMELQAIKSRKLLNLPQKAPPAADGRMEEFWLGFGTLKRKCLALPETPALAVKKSLEASFRFLATGPDMESKAYQKTLGEAVPRGQFYKQTLLTMNNETGDRMRKEQLEEEFKATHLLADSAVEFSWDEFRAFLKKFSVEFCHGLDELLHDSLYFDRFPEGLFNELRALVTSELFKPIALLGSKNKIGAKLCLWCRRVIALLYDQHLVNIKAALPNIADAALMAPTHGQEDINAKLMQGIIEDYYGLAEHYESNTPKGRSRLQKQLSGSLFDLHGLSISSSRDRIAQMINYQGVGRYQHWDGAAGGGDSFHVHHHHQSVASVGGSAAGSAAAANKYDHVHSHEHNVSLELPNVREPLQFVLGVVAAPVVDELAGYAGLADDAGSGISEAEMDVSAKAQLSVLPTEASFLAFVVTMALLRPMDSVQLVCCKNTSVRRDQREARIALMRSLNRNNVAAGGGGNGAGDSSGAMGEAAMGGSSAHSLGGDSGLCTLSPRAAAVRTREDLEVYEKEILKEFFDEEFLRYSFHSGGMPSPTYGVTVMPTQRQRRQKLYNFAALSLNAETMHQLDSTMKPVSAKQLEEMSADGSAKSSGNGHRQGHGNSKHAHGQGQGHQSLAAAALEDGSLATEVCFADATPLQKRLMLHYEPHEALQFASKRSPQGGTFVVIGYEYGLDTAGNRASPGGSRAGSPGVVAGAGNMSPNGSRVGSDGRQLVANKHSLVNNCGGWVHKNAIIRDASSSIVIAKPCAVQLDAPVRYVVAVNESQSSLYALQTAARLAKPCDVISVFHVVDVHRFLSRAEEKMFNREVQKEQQAEEERIAAVEAQRQEEEALKGGDSGDAKERAATPGQAAKHGTTVIPPVKPGTPSYTTSALHRREVHSLKSFARAAAIRRAKGIVERYKKFGYNVLVVDDSSNQVGGNRYADDSESFGVNEDPEFPAHPLVQLADRITKVAADLLPTFLVMGSGNYGKSTLQRYYDKTIPEPRPEVMEVTAHRSGGSCRGAGSTGGDGDNSLETCSTDSDEDDSDMRSPKLNMASFQVDPKRQKSAAAIALQEAIGASIAVRGDSTMNSVNTSIASTSRRPEVSPGPTKAPTNYALADMGDEEDFVEIQEEEDRNASDNVLLTLTEAVADHNLAEFSVIAARFRK